MSVYSLNQKRPLRTELEFSATVACGQTMISASIHFIWTKGGIMVLRGWPSPHLRFKIWVLSNVKCPEGRLQT